MKSIWILAILAVSAQSAHASGGDEVGERILSNLVRQAQQWRASASDEQLSALAEREARITECPNGAKLPDDGAAVTRIKDIEFAIATIDTGEDSYCYYLARPFVRPLSVAEAHALQAAAFFPEQLTITPKVANAANGEKLFSDLREAIQSKKYAVVPMADGTAEETDTRLRACGPSDYSSRREGPRSIEFIYNAVYSWSKMSDNGVVCVWMYTPFSRGLLLEEAQDFIKATRSAMGTSESLLGERQ